jgi:threonylcarbamoyladenosine tRNA methylthiotransferase MtaB
VADGSSEGDGAAPEPAPPRATLPRVALVGLGCRVNRADLDALASELHGRFAVAAEGEPADFVVVNTCSITGDADAAARQAIRRAAKDHPGARIVAAGCYAELAPETLGALPNVVAVVGARSHTAIAGLLDRLHACEPAEAAGRAARAEAPDWGATPTELARHTRPFLKIQDGCDARCSYCVVPLARGWSRSLAFDEALARIALLGERHREVVLTGVHLGAYGKDLDPARSIEDLVRAAVARGFPGRLRLSSIEPLEAPIELFRDPATARSLCEHVHLPLQSASETLLARMRRPYRAAAYARVVEALAAASPGICIGADVMCGFPGETPEDHAATVRLAEALPLAYLHVFPFSPRPGTPAAWYSPAVPAGAVRERVRELLAVSDRKWRSFLHGLTGREVDVVVERIEGGVARGTSRQWATVRWPASSERRGDLVRVRVDASDAGGCWGVRADRYRSVLPV